MTAELRQPPQPIGVPVQAQRMGRGQPDAGFLVRQGVSDRRVRFRRFEARERPDRVAAATNGDATVDHLLQHGHRFAAPLAQVMNRPVAHYPARIVQPPGQVWRRKLVPAQGQTAGILLSGAPRRRMR